MIDDLPGRTTEARPTISGSSVRVTRLSTTPIKGLGLQHPDVVWLDAKGARGDRDFFMVDRSGRLLSIPATGRFAGCHAGYELASNQLVLTFPDGSTCAGEVTLGDPCAVDCQGRRWLRGRAVNGPWAAALSERGGQPLRLVKCDEPGDASDVQPVTLLGSGSVAELSRRLGTHVDARRFRMLIEFQSDEPHIEDTWRERTLDSGRAALSVRGPVPRCAAITRHPDEGQRDLALVRLIRDYRGLVDTELGRGVPFGVYATVLRNGPLRVGDELRLVPGS